MVIGINIKILKISLILVLNIILIKFNIFFVCHIGRWEQQGADSYNQEETTEISWEMTGKEGPYGI